MVVKSPSSTQILLHPARDASISWSIIEVELLCIPMRPKKLPACDRCRSMKLACDHARPICTRCRERGRAATCVYRPRPFKRSIEESPTWNDARVSTRQSEPTLSPTDTSDNGESTNQPFHYPNPGYLGSSSHTTLFDQLRLVKGQEMDELYPEMEQSASPQTDLVIDDSFISSGADLVADLCRLSKIPSFVQLVQTWIAKGANLALAGPFTERCALTTQYLLSNCHGSASAATDIPKSLFLQSRRPIVFNADTTLEEFCTNFCNHNGRWETLGLFFTAACRASTDLSYAEPLYTTERQRCKFQRLALRYSDRCLDMSLSLDCLNDLQLFLQYENFISHSQIDGDQSYRSWRKLGDVASSLFALGYHQQTEVTENVPLFLQDLRRIAFARSYSADKNVSIFLGRPPRITREFCRFRLPGSHSQQSEEVSRKPANWDITESISFVTDTRWAALCAVLKEDILHVFGQDNYDERVRQAQLIQADAEGQWLALPAHYRLECSLKSCDGRPVDRDFLVNARLNYLHVLFLLRLALLRPASDLDSSLLSISVDMLSLVIEAVMAKDQLINSGTSLVWKVVYYGLASAGVICLALVNQTFSSANLNIEISNVFQDLSILVAEVERGTLVYLERPNYALLVRATQTIKTLLDRMLSPSNGFMASMASQQLGQPALNDLTTTMNESSWDVWESNRVQEFEMNFWLNLADHPFLNN